MNERVLMHKLDAALARATTAEFARDRYREALQDIDAAVSLNGSDALPHIARIVDFALAAGSVETDQ